MDISKHPCSSLKILFHSVASYVRSGYGNITRHVAGRLKRMGLDIIVSTYYGLEPGGVLNIDGLPHVPVEKVAFGRDSVIRYYQKFERNLAVLVPDFWAFEWFTSLPNCLLYSPMDHYDYPEEIINIIKRFSYVCSLLPFQMKELLRRGIKSYLIPHGVDTVFQPMEKEEARRRSGFPEDYFILGVVGANSDKEARKGFFEMFQALELLLNERPMLRNRIRVFFHTNPDSPNGIPLRLLASASQTSDICVFEDSHLSLTGISDEDLCNLYNSFDVLLCPSRREGFCLPVIEAMACGVPSIGSRTTSFPDLIGENEERGWLAEIKGYLRTPLGGLSAFVDPVSIKDKILEAYDNPEEVKKKGKAGFIFSRDFLWDKIIEEKWIPLLDKIAVDISAESPEVRKL